MSTKNKIKFLRKISLFRQKGKNNYYILVFASIVVGFATGLGAVILKNSVHYIHKLILPHNSNNFGITYFIFPFLGMILTYAYLKISKFKIKPGVPNLLFSISKNNGFIKPHNIFSSIIGAMLTVGFGAPAGLESPNISTGAGLGSYIAKTLKLTYRQRIILLGVAAAGTISAIFKAPITGIIFAVEVIMIDLTSLSIIPVLLASVTASLTSYFFLGSNFLYSLDVYTIFKTKEIPFYILIGVLTGFFALYYSSLYEKSKKIFKKSKNIFVRFLVAGLIIGILVYLFPATFAEGYNVLNAAIDGDYSYLHHKYILTSFTKNSTAIIVLFFVLALVKSFLNSITVAAGGIGGFFTPILFTGANLGLFMSHLFAKIGITVSHESAALVAMGGLISAMMHAPLSSVFFIGELTGGYSLMLPLLITSSVSYFTIRIFQKHNFFAEELAKKKMLFTHHADENILKILKLEDLVEKDFITIDSRSTLGDLVEVVKISHRDLFIVIDCENHFLGVISLDRIRKIMFKPDLYDKIKVSELMIFPSTFVEIDEHLESVAEKFETTQRYNLLVLDKGKYVGFLSRSHFFSQYRQLLRDFSAR